MAKNQRKIFRSPLIQPAFQRRFVTVSLLAGAAGLVICYLATRIFFSQFAGLAAELRLPADHMFYKLLAQQRTTMDAVLLSAAILCMAGWTLGALLWSRKIVAPLQRLKQELESRTPGEVKGRKGDYFGELLEAYNGHVRPRSETVKTKRHLRLVS